MAKERNALKAGIFIAVSIVLTLGVIVAISGTDAVFQPKQVRKVIFSLHDDIGGLQPGDPVRIGGFTVGAIRSINVIQLAEGTQTATGPASRSTDAAMKSFTEITISLPRKYVIREHAVLEINGTLIGASWLNFATLGDGNPLPPDAVIAGRASGMSAAVRQLYELMPQIQHTIAIVNEQTLPAINADLAKFGSTADSFTRVSDSGHELVVHVNKSIDPLFNQVSTVATDASGALQEIKGVAHHVDTDVVPNVAAAATTLKERLPPLFDRTTTLLVKGDKTIKSATATLGEIKATFSNTKDMTATGKEVIVGSKSKLESIIASLKTTADNLKSASVEIRHSPWRLIYKPGPNEIGNLNIYDAARQFSDGAGALKDSAEALRDAANKKNVTPEQLKPLIDKLDSSFDNFNAIEKQLWNAVKE